MARTKQGPSMKRRTPPGEVGPEGSSSPPSKAARASTDDATQEASRWSMTLIGEDGGDRVQRQLHLELCFEDVEQVGDEVVDGIGHSADDEACVRREGVEERVQQMAVASGTMEDIIECNDVLHAAVDSAMGTMQMEVVKAVELGDVPLELMPKETAEFMKSMKDGKDGVNDVEKQLELLQHYTAQAEVEITNEEDRAEAALKVRNVEEVKLGSTYRNLVIAEHVVRMTSHAPLVKFPGMAEKTIIMGCRSNKAVRKPPPGEGSFAKRFLQSPGCQCVVQLQTLKVKQLRSGSYHRTGLAKEIYAKECGSDGVEASAPCFPHCCPDMVPVQQVVACTLFKGHTCLAGPSSSCTSDAPSSAAALVEQGNFGRRVPAPQLASAIKSKYEAAGGCWGGKQVCALWLYKLCPTLRKETLPNFTFKRETSWNFTFKRETLWNFTLKRET